MSKEIRSIFTPRKLSAAERAQLDFEVKESMERIEAKIKARREKLRKNGKDAAQRYW